MLQCFNARMRECENLGNRTSLPAWRDSAKLMHEYFKNLKSPIWNLQSSINATMLQCFNAWMLECGNAWKRTSLTAGRDSGKLMRECVIWWYASVLKREFVKYSFLSFWLDPKERKDQDAHSLVKLLILAVIHCELVLSSSNSAIPKCLLAVVILN